MRMDCRMPEEKLRALRSEVTRVAGPVREACEIIPMERIFCRQRVVFPHHYVHLGWELHGDLRVWETFLDQFNGWALWMSEAVKAF